MKKIIFVILMIWISILMIPCYGYDKAEDLYNDYAPSPFRDFLSAPYNDKSDSIVRVETHGHALTLIPFLDLLDPAPAKAIGEFLMLGSGFAVANYIITAAHVIHPDTAMVRISNNALIHTASIIKILDRSINIRATFYDWFDGSIPAQIEHIDVGNDLCILSYQKEWASWIHPLPFTLGSEFIHPDMAIATLVRDRSDGEPTWFTIARYGRVINRNVIVPEDYIHVLPFWGLAEVTCELEIYPGDSGSPVFGFIDGKPVLIGVITKKLLVEPLYSYFTRLGILGRLIAC